jgi:hypothetical protein
MRAAILSLAVLLLAATRALAAPSLEVIELRSRSAEEMIPLIHPLADPGTTLTGKGYQLIIKAEPAQMIELQRLVRQLDTPLRNLLITVRQITREEARQSEVGASGRIGSGQGAQVDLRLRAGDDAYARDGSYRVRTIEGREAFVRVGQRVPYPGRYDPYGQGVDYHLVSSGFYVTPHLRGDGVELEISPRQDRLLPGHRGTVETQSVNTVVHGALGEWIDIGSAAQQSEAEGREIAGRETASGDQEYFTQVRVDLVR